MTEPTTPIRKSSLPCTPPPEWEFHTWFPHPDGGGDMVPGQRQRGILVRRRVSYGDWEPVRPDRWADEPPTDASSAGVVQLPPTNQAAELDRLRTENERMRHELEVMYGGAFDSPRPAPVDRAAVLLEAADGFDARAAALAEDLDGLAGFVAKARINGAAVWRDGAEELRRMAAEAPATEERSDVERANT